MVGSSSLTKKTFRAYDWFQIETPAETAEVVSPEISACPVRARFPTFIHQQKITTKKNLETSDKFSPVHCFVPGWKGDSLSSKIVLKFERLLNQVTQDVKNELMKTKDFPRTIKIGLYNEFLSYAESLGLHFNQMDDLSGFWNLLDPEKLSENEKLSEFIDIYASRVATVTFSKLRFIGTLIDRCGLPMTDKALLYPTSYLSQIFKKGSLTELNSRALESNLYSWYRPHEGMKEVMKELLILSNDLSITEIIKNVSFRTQIKSEQQKVYSHALSHVSFGLFLNSLQINFPMWLGAVEGRSIPQGSLEQESVISCKYFGDYLESMALSHWLAQENNKDFRWDETLCPDFKGTEFISGAFIKICNELQFLTFLAHKAEHQDERPIDYICKIMGGHYRNRKGGAPKSGMLLADNPFYSSTYDRVVLNLCHFPKNNPQHYLMNQILEQVKYLKPNGYLFVLSSKKLFVPSLRERIEPVLKEFKTEAIFDFENVKGKGELGSYIYIFRKNQSETVERQLCSYFRISANLETFTEFSSITEHLRSFYLSNLDEMPSMTQLEFQDGFRVEFFQEAIVNGMLIHSTNEDSSRITHPSYFKGLIDNCVPLDHLFEIKVLDHSHKTSRENSLNLGLKKDLSYFLVVDFRNEEVVVELHPMDTFRSVFSDYGQTLCSYFQLQSKFPGLNPNILRNYFLTPVGKQVTQLTFSGGPSLVKGSLSKLFVPKFLTQTEKFPDQLEAGFKILDMSDETLLETAPKNVLKSYNHIDQIARDLFPRHACEILSRFSNFERTLQSIIWKMDDGRFGQKMSFNNPVIQARLVQKPTKPLYPDNEDVYIEFASDGVANDIHLPLTETQLSVTQEGDLKLYSLEFISHGKIVVRLHAEESLINFIQFLLGHANGVPIAKILKAVHIPSINDLKSIIEDSQSFKVIYQELLDRVQKSITDAFRIHVTPKRSL